MNDGLFQLIVMDLTFSELTEHCCKIAGLR